MWRLGRIKLCREVTIPLSEFGALVHEGIDGAFSLFVCPTLYYTLDLVFIVVIIVISNFMAFRPLQVQVFRLYQENDICKGYKSLESLSRMQASKQWLIYEVLKPRRLSSRLRVR